jgi:hypothetical protein
VETRNETLLKGIKMNTETKNQPKEFYTASQMNWMLTKGYAWGEKPIEELDHRDPIYTRHGQYLWTVPYIDRDGKVAGGRYDLF